jgi:diguanylate cyclase (GGDEF)-like protein
MPAPLQREFVEFGNTMTDERLKERIAELEQELASSREHEKMLGDLLEKKLNEIYVHYHISRTIGSQLVLETMLEQVVDTIKKALPLERISVYLLDESRTQLSLYLASGFNAELARPIAVGEGAPGRIVETGEHVHIHDLSLFYETLNDFIHYPGEEARDGSYIGIALKTHNKTIGMLGMDNRIKYGLSVEDMDFMAILSHQLAAGIEKTRLFEKIRDLSQHDGLTGLHNHRFFQERLRQEINKHERNGKPLSLIMLDIDHFKRYNDDYGHQAGDEVLRELAKIITSHTRCDSNDIGCRYGGEEFAMIMPELGLQYAVKVAERLRKAVENAIFILSDSKKESKVTVSLGVASLAENIHAKPEELVKQADDALYRSKKSGKNQVSFSEAKNDNA